MGWLLPTVLHSLRLDVMSLSAECIFQARNHKTCVSGIMVKQSAGNDITSNLEVGQSV